MRSDDRSAPKSSLADARPAAEAIRGADGRAVDVGLILGSGLGDLVEAARAVRTFPGTELPGYPVASAEGHAGEVALGEIGGRVVAFIRGRFHYYEGHPYERLGLPVRLLHLLGAGRLVVTNAAGGIREDLEPGRFMLIRDHFAAVGPGRPPASTAEPTERAGSPAVRTPGSTVYGAESRARARAAFERVGLTVAEGTYGWMPGPSYETPAEIRMLRRMGADVVGMSTVPEVTQARLLDMTVLGVSTVTNRAAGLAGGGLAHEEVVEVGTRRSGRLAEALMTMLTPIDHDSATAPL